MRPLVVFSLFAGLISVGCRSTHYHHSHSIASPSSYSGVAKAPIQQPAFGFRGKRTPTSFATGERYAFRENNQFRATRLSPLSTFSVDVDTASYSNVRRMIEGKIEVPKGAVRIEEMVNYFDYDYPAPQNDLPFSVASEVASCPWKPRHQLVRVALSGKDMKTQERPSANLVFLVDVSGSMGSENKLPLLKRSLLMLANQMRADDRIAVVVYAGSSGVALPSTPCSDLDAIHEAMDRLQSGGSTAGGAGIELAYRVAKENFQRDGINRVILATDGDFNVGPSSDSALVDLIEEKAKSGIYLSVLGFGMGNYNDSMLEKLSGKGNGNYAYIDTLNEARKVMVEETAGTLMTIAKDVKIQVEFNPAKVRAYRLIGYENRILEDRDFSDDKKDAGEIGAGHQVTAFYEIVPRGVPFSQPEAEDLKYQDTEESFREVAMTEELMTVKLRYKEPEGRNSKLVSFPIEDSDRSFAKASSDFRFATAVAAFGMRLRESPHAGQTTRRDILVWSQEGARKDPLGLREEFRELVRRSSI